MPARRLVPVIALTGHLGAGKTTVLNSLLRAPGARLGVIINDFGEINVDTALVTGQIDEAASVAGGCLCCLPDTTPLDEALERLSHPRLALDAILVEASGAAEPLALSHVIRYSAAERTRTAGLIEVVDATAYFDIVDPGGDGASARAAPARFSAASLVVLTKTDLLPASARERVVAAISARVRERNEQVHIVRAQHGALDPALVLDVADQQDPEDQLPLAALARDAYVEHLHEHAQAVTVRAEGPIEPAGLIDLLESPPDGAYRLKGVVGVRTSRTCRRYVVNVVGRRIHIAPLPEDVSEDRVEPGLVAIGMHLDGEEAHRRLEEALQPAGRASAQGMSRLLRYRRLSE